MAREAIDCVQCGGTAGWYYPAKTYGDPDDCSPAEDTVEFCDDGDRPFCSEACMAEWHEEHDEPEEIEEEI